MQDGNLNGLQNQLRGFSGELRDLGGQGLFQLRRAGERRRVEGGLALIFLQVELAAKQVRRLRNQVADCAVADRGGAEHHRGRAKWYLPQGIDDGGKRKRGRMRGVEELVAA